MQFLSDGIHTDITDLAQATGSEGLGDFVVTGARTAEAFLDKASGG